MAVIRSAGLAAALAGLAIVPSAAAAPVVRAASGANPAAIQATVDQFRVDLGALNANTAGSVGTGRREINWDGVPNGQAAPNPLPANFWNVNSPRGVILSSAAATDSFMVSASAGNPTATPVEFGDLDASYPTSFQPFSPQRMFAATGSTLTELLFFVPGTDTPATVTGFGAVFTDVDSASSTYVKAYSASGALLSTVAVPAANNGLSFAGATYDVGERVARAQVVAGNAPLAAASPDGGAASDKVAVDDLIFGEPSVPPQTTISAKPPRITAKRKATFQFGSIPANAAATFECKLDAKPAAACASPKTYLNLKPGKHTFTVAATLGGLVDSTPARATWKIRR